MDIMIILEVGILLMGMALAPQAPIYKARPTKKTAKKRGSKPSIATA